MVTDALIDAMEHLSKLCAAERIDLQAIRAARLEVQKILDDAGQT